MVNNWLKVFSFIALSLLQGSLNAAEITVSSDRDPVALDESFTLTFESEQSVDDDPDFTPLERDFQILSRSQSSSVQWINRRKSSKESWILTLMAKKRGQLTVPPIRFGDDISPILKITVTDSAQAQQKGKNGGVDPIFLEVSADRESVYLQAQLLYTVRFYTATRIMGYTLSEPTFSKGSAITKKLGDDYKFETMRGGHRYVVVERRYAIFPQTTGELVISPLIFEGQIFSGRQSALQLFNQQFKTKRIRSERVTVRVKPVPASFSGGEWFPASQVTLDSEWLSQEFRVGEPVTRKLKIGAVGVDSTLIPSLSKSKKVSGIKIYPDQPQLQDNMGSGGLIGERLESIAVIPTRAGKLVMPEIKLAWWDVNEERERVEVIPQMVVDVLPSADITPMPPEPQKNDPQVDDAVKSRAELVQGGVPFYWRWLSYLLAAGWAVTLLVWWWHARTMRLGFDGAITEKNTKTKGPSRRALEKRLKKACQSNDARAVEDALLDWVELVWVHDPPSNLTEIASRVDEEFAEQLEALNRAIYSNGASGGEWHCELWELAKSFRLKKVVMDREDGVEALSRLYPSKKS
ncbi:MAG: hypothetical protein GQ470_06430 [Gammaproteobacteria bacterium]|nr:hypothetical protein [Gammaproteobacteria bacterium]